MICLVIVLLLADLTSTYNLRCDNSEQIPDTAWCNAIHDCLDRSDERPGCCPAGLQRADGICVDVNECTRHGPLVCSQHCTNTHGSFLCSCDKGYSLQENPADGRATICKANTSPGEPLFLFSVDNVILKTTGFQTFEMLRMDGVEDSYHVYDFDYDYRNNLMFWCAGDELEYESALHKNLWKARIMENNLVEAEVIAPRVDCVSLSVDWVNHKVYWVTKETGQLVVSSYDGQNQIILLYLNLERLRAVAVSPKAGYVFWSDWGTDPHIGRASMDGSQQMFLLQKSEGDIIQQPTALTVDHSSDRLYWMDAYHMTLHVMDYAGNSFALQERNPSIANVWRMAVWEDRVYWLDYHMDSISTILKSASKMDGEDFQQFPLRGIESSVTEVRILHPLLQPPHPNACNRHLCNHLCLLTPTGHECKCDNGYLLLGDGRSCEKLNNPCTVDSCDPHNCIMCGNGACKIARLRCDGENDCPDGSDEMDCLTSAAVLSNCLGSEYTCASARQCVKAEYVCDGERDCNDGSDEEPYQNCDVVNQCARESFVCDRSTCLAREKRCNGVVDCIDGTDEISCDVPECSDTQFTCTDSRRCIDNSRRCDGNVDCSDHSDEFNCVRECRETEFRCESGQPPCIAMGSRCDGTQDCSDFSDEHDCQPGPELRMCKTGMLKCPNSDQCIAEERFCNGEPDCKAGEDEVGCNCLTDQYPCPNSQECILREEWCDGVPHCEHGSDEQDRCCRLGYTRVDDGNGSRCVDENECLRQDGVCSQHCNNNEGGYTCSCDDGYDLINNTYRINNRSPTESYCQAKDGPMSIIITVEREGPYFLTLPESSEKSITENLAEGKFTSMAVTGDYEPRNFLMADFGFDYRRQKMCWCAGEHYGTATYNKALWIADLASNLQSVDNSRVIVRNINCDSLAVDWINQLIYFTSDTNAIEVVDYSGTNRRALIWTGLSKPRAIEVDPDEGLLFYTDWGKKTAHLGRANMDGSDRRILINNTRQQQQIKWPNALTLDHPNKNLYWMDANLKSVECMRYDGSARYTITSNDDYLGHPWRMGVFEDWIFWRDNHYGNILSANKFNGNPLRRNIVVTNTGEKVDRGNGFRLYHGVVQPMSEPRCRPGSCSNMCLPVPRGFQCACPTGQALVGDSYSVNYCTKDSETYAYVAMEDMIVKVALDPLEPVPQPIAFQSDQYLEGTYWSIDHHDHWVYFNTLTNDNNVVNIKRTNGAEEEVVVNGRSWGGLSIDWQNKKIYWASRGTVSVGQLDGSVHTTLLQKENFQFRAIIVDPCSGYIYLAATAKGIYRVSMDGDMDTFTRVVEVGPHDSPGALALDKDSSSLFYAVDRVLYQAFLSRSPVVQVKVVTREPGTSIRSADIWGRDKIIWTEYYQTNETEGHRYSRIVAMPKITAAEPQVIREGITKDAYGIKVYPKRGTNCESTEKNPCLYNECSDMCLQRAASTSGPGRTGRKRWRCVCPTGYALRKNSTTQCATEIEQYLVYNPANGIQTVSLDTSILTPIKEPPSMQFKVTAFDIDAKNNLVYYCYGNPNKFQYRGLFDATRNATTLPIHTLQCSGMAVEWVTNKLYIVDKGDGEESGLILVVDLNRPHLIKHIVTSLRQPLKIVVHPLRGKVYWILASHSIMSTNMDGTDTIETIVSHRENHPPTYRTLTEDATTQIFIDYETDHLYWIENVVQQDVGFVGLVRRVDLNTKGVEDVLEHRGKSSSGATLINNVLYHTDLGDGMLYRRDEGNSSTFLLSTGSAQGHPTFLRSSQGQPELLVNPCLDHNGGCSDFCLLDNVVGFRCSCTTGVQLQDSMNCDTPHNKSLVVANATRISMISLNEPVIDRVLTSAPRNLRSIDVDIRQNKVYWSEKGPKGGAIWSLDMSRGVTEKIVSENLKNPNSIAVDWNAQNIYWVDSGPDGKGTLEVMSVKSRKRSVLQRYEDRILVLKPHQVVIDPNERVLFVSYPVPQKEVITRMWMDGSNSYSIDMDDSLPTKRSNPIVSYLAIDLIEKRLYWSSHDGMYHITSCDYRGKNQNVINGVVGRLTSMSILNKNLFLPIQSLQDTNPGQGTQVKEYVNYDIPQTSQSQNTQPLNTYTFHHQKGFIVSMDVNDARVLKHDIPTPCLWEGRREVCPDQICIPIDIDPFYLCKCGDDDTFCQQLQEQKEEVVVSYLPDDNNRCPANYCNAHGSCLRIRIYNSSKYNLRCDCDPGYAQPRCASKTDGDGHIKTTVVAVCIFLVIIIFIILFGFYAKRIFCANDKTDGISNQSSELEDDARFNPKDHQTNQLRKLAKPKTLGQHYARVQTETDNV